MGKLKTGKMLELYFEISVSIIPSLVYLERSLFLLIFLSP